MENQNRLNSCDSKDIYVVVLYNIVKDNLGAYKVGTYFIEFAMLVHVMVQQSCDCEVLFPAPE